MGVTTTAFSIVLLGCVASCNCNSKSGTQTPEGTLRRIAVDTGLAVPSDAQLVHFSEPARIVDPLWVAKLVVPPSSYSQFEESLLSKSADQTRYSGLAETTVWWKPENAVLKKQFLADSHTFVVVEVAKEGDMYAIYVECQVH